MRSVKLWSRPLRAANWLLASLLVLCFATAKATGAGHVLHIISGYGVSILLIYRIVIGFSDHGAAGFEKMVHPWRDIVEQIRLFFVYRSKRWAGHSPLGGLTAMVFIILLGMTVISGMVIMNGAPLQAFHAAAGLGGFYLAMVWLAITLCYSLFYDRGLLRSMLSGRNIVSEEQGQTLPRDRSLSEGSMQGSPMAFAWTALLSTALLPLGWQTPQSHQKPAYIKTDPTVKTALREAPYRYDPSRMTDTVQVAEHDLIFDIDKVKITWAPSLQTGLDYASYQYSPGSDDLMLADEKLLSDIATAAGGQADENTPAKETGTQPSEAHQTGH